VEALLDMKFPVPLLENPLGSSTAKYDSPLVNATAYIACSLIAGRKEPPKYDANGAAQNIAAELFLAGKSIIDQYNNGQMRFSWELTKDEIGSTNIVATTTNTSIGMFQIRGTFSGDDDTRWILQIVTGGAIETATYAISEDNGTTYGDAVTTDMDWADLGSDLEIRFFERGATTTAFIANDTWKLYLVAADNNTTRSRIGNVSLIG
jgi:hypothetical protein